MNPGSIDRFKIGITESLNFDWLLLLGQNRQNRIVHLTQRLYISDSISLIWKRCLLGVFVILRLLIVCSVAVKLKYFLWCFWLSRAHVFSYCWCFYCVLLACFSWLRYIQIRILMQHYVLVRFMVFIIDLELLLVLVLWLICCIG